MRLHRDLKITQKSAYFMAQRLREAWTEGHGGMAGPIEVDETHVGGKERSLGYRPPAPETILPNVDGPTYAVDGLWLAHQLNPRQTLT